MTSKEPNLRVLLVLVTDGSGEQKLDKRSLILFALSSIGISPSPIFFQKSMDCRSKILAMASGLIRRLNSSGQVLSFASQLVITLTTTQSNERQHHFAKAQNHGLQAQFSRQPVENVETIHAFIYRLTAPCCKVIFKIYFYLNLW